jgi:hypothetical protein
LHDVPILQLNNNDIEIGTIPTSLRDSLKVGMVFKLRQESRASKEKPKNENQLPTQSRKDAKKRHF